MEFVNGNTVKENLVARVADWEGLHCAEALIDGKPMEGMWYDRAIEYEVHRQAERKAARNDTPVEPVKRGDFMTPYELILAPLPCWRGCRRPRSGSEWLSYRLTAPDDSTDRPVSAPAKPRWSWHPDSRTITNTLHSSASSECRHASQTGVSFGGWISSVNPASPRGTARVQPEHSVSWLMKAMKLAMVRPTRPR